MKKKSLSGKGESSRIHKTNVVTSRTHFMGPPHLYEKFSQINTDWYFREKKYNILVCAYFEKERIVIN